MFLHHTSTQQRRAGATSPRRRRRASVPFHLLDGRRVKAADGSGREGTAPAPVLVNQTKVAIIAVMQELERPVSSAELQAIWAEHKDLRIFEYHLSTLVKAKVAEVVYGPELHFQLIDACGGPEIVVREWCR
jgi:hypothetical protein